MLAMREVTAPIVAISLVLMAVFLPVAFLPGTTGELYQQFALTIACSVAISALNALTLSPALCALLLRAAASPRARARSAPSIAASRASRDLYERVGRAARSRTGRLVLGVFASLVVATVVLYRGVPTGFLPDEDLGYFIVSVQLPDGASLERTERGDQGGRRRCCSRSRASRNAVVIGGFDFLHRHRRLERGVLLRDPRSVGRAQVARAARSRPSSRARAAELGAIAERRRHRVQSAADPRARLDRRLPAPGPGRGRREPRRTSPAGRSADRRRGTHRAWCTGLVTTLRANVPQYAIEIDRTKAKTLGLSLSDVFGTLQAYLGGYYVNDFNRFGRVFRVFVQAERGDRAAARRRHAAVRAQRARRDGAARDARDA